MSDYVADRWGRNLTKYDIKSLKEEIIRPTLGEKFKIPRSRREILKLSYSIDSTKTMEYIIRKSDNALREALMRYRDMLLDIGMNTQNPKQASEVLEKFEKTENKYHSIVKAEDFHDVMPFPKKRIEQLRERVEKIKQHYSKEAPAKSSA
jgi:uncharacterized protein involved in exopolysaccharide biosynthesis